MSIEFYRVAHVAGLLLLFLGLGGMFAAGRGDGAKAPKLASILHGVGLLVMIVAGFGMMARLSIQWPWPGWLFCKLGIWLLLGALPVLVKRRLVPSGLGWLVAAALGALAFWLVKTQPF